MTNGGIKDANYLALQDIPVVAKLDEDVTTYDMEIFDGAKIVSKRDA